MVGARQCASGFYSMCDCNKFDWLRLLPACDAGRWDVAAEDRALSSAIGGAVIRTPELNLLLFPVQLPVPVPFPLDAAVLVPNTAKYQLI